MADTPVFSSFRRPGLSHAKPSAQPPVAPAELPEVSSPPIATAVIVAGPAPERQDVGRASPNEFVEGPISITDQPHSSAWSVLRNVVAADQLGLAHPDVILLQAKIHGDPPVVLEAQTAGIYRPPGFRRAPWDGVVYDQPNQAPGAGLR